MKKNKILLSALFSTVILGSVTINTDINLENGTALFSLNRAQAIKSDYEFMAGGILTDNIFKIDVPDGSIPASFSWDINGKGTTKIIVEKGDGIIGKTSGEGYWPSSSATHQMDVYSNKQGSEYRFQNVGLTSDGQVMDILMRVDNKADSLDKVPAGTLSGFNMFKGPMNTIGIESVGIDVLETTVTYVKTGTRTPVNILTGTYWSDIDARQGLDENMTNIKAIFGPKDIATKYMDVDPKNGTVYARTKAPFSNMLDPNEAAYIGIGSGSSFKLKFHVQYFGPKSDNDPLDAEWLRNNSRYNFRYDMFGQFNNIAFPPSVTDPIKTVSDVDEKKVVSSSTGLAIREQEYDMSVKVNGGTYLEDLTLTDTFPNEFKTDKSRVRITGLDGKDITNAFDINVSGQNLIVKLKESERRNKALFSTRINVNVKGNLPEWSGTKFDNKANWTYNNKEMPTNNVSSVTPSKPEAKKEVSVSNGAEWEIADTLQTAAKADKVLDPYKWKLDYTLSNYTNYTGIELVDHLETIQSADLSKVKVYDISSGSPKPITDQGKLTTKPNGTKTDIIWTANPAYIQSLNTNYGIKSAAKPKLRMEIETDISKASRAQKDAYKQNELGYIIVPNTGSLIETDHTGSATMKTNPSHITFPNEIEEPKKKVSDNGGENKVDKNHPGLKARNQEYDISIKTSTGYGFNKLELADTFPKEFKTSTDQVRITNSSGADLTSKFNITLSGQNFKAVLKPEFKNDSALKGTVINAKIKGTIPDWLGEVLPNDAIWTADVNKPTNKVETFLPSKPEVKKSVSVNGGNYVSASSPKEAAKINKNKDSYTWKLDYTLSNYTKFSGIEFTDEFENLQTFNKGDFKVFDAQGRDVTSQGTLTETPSGNKTKLSWKANSGYVNTVNSTYGNESKTAPKFRLEIKTDLSKATREQKAKYVNGETGYIVIPNVGSLIETDHTGSVTEISNKSHVTPPNELFEQKKKVSDDDEEKVDENWTGLKVRHQEYDISVETDKGYGFVKLEMADQLPKEFSTSVDKVKITTKDGKDVTNKFDITIKDQLLVASLKEVHYNDVDLKGTIITTNVKGTLPEWLGESFTNEALWTSDEDKPTNKVETFEPSKPIVEKSISLDEKEFNKSDKSEEASELEVRSDEYTWKLDFELSNFTEFSSIELVDHFENLQAINKDNVKIYDIDGNDVTEHGSILIEDTKGLATDVTWKASEDYIKEINKKFGKKSKEHPKFAMKIKTSVKDATSEQESKYFDEKLGKVVIPNTGKLIISDHTGSVEEDSNTSYVALPKPGDSSITKFISKDGTDPLKDEGWSDKLTLDNHDQLYSYKTVFNLSKNFNYDDGSLVLTDRFENLQSYKDIKILDSTGKDRTKEFKFTETKHNKDFTTYISATPLKSSDFDDKGETLIMYIESATLTGATGEQESYYIGEFKEKKQFGDKIPFKGGIVIPNSSELIQNSKIPTYKTEQLSNHTYTNFLVEGSLIKSVELNSIEITDPIDATNEDGSSDK